MEDMEVNELFKQRSITACMKASYGIIADNIKLFIKQTRKTHIPFAVLLALTLYFFLPNKSLHDWGETNPLASFCVQTMIYGATIVMAFIAFWYLLPHKQLVANGEKRKMGQSIIRILHHLGGFLMTSFLGMLIIGISTFIVAVPSLILIIAQFNSQLGALDGDPIGVPSYFTPLLLIVFIVTCIFFVYALSWLGISFAYLYGSYKVTDEEKKNLSINMKY